MSNSFLSGPCSRAKSLRLAHRGGLRATMPLSIKARCWHHYPLGIWKYSKGLLPTPVPDNQYSRRSGWEADCGTAVALKVVAASRVLKGSWEKKKPHRPWLGPPALWLRGLMGTLPGNGGGEDSALCMLKLLRARPRMRLDLILC
jgi:hypothetical protein